MNPLGKNPCVAGFTQTWYFFTMDARQRAIVIGGGLTGLACAYRLKQSGIPVLLLEAADFAGGMMATAEKNGFLFEAGPQCPRFPLPLWELVHDLKLEGEFVPGDSRLPRYIVKNGHLHEAPFSPFSFIFTQLVGAASKYRILTEILRRSQPPPWRGVPWPALFGENSMTTFWPIWAIPSFPRFSLETRRKWASTARSRFSPDGSESTEACCVARSDPENATLRPRLEKSLSL